MALTDTTIKSAKPRDKDYKLSDGGGMYLLVKKHGNKYWRINYRFRGKHKTLSLGVYPNVGLKAARDKRSAVKQLLERNIDPSEARREESRKQDIATFEDVAKQWWEHQRQTWIKSHAEQVWRRLKDNSFADIGHLSIDEITPKRVIAVVKKVEARGSLDVANRVKQHINAVCQYAVQHGIAIYKEKAFSIRFII